MPGQVVPLTEGPTDSKDNNNEGNTNGGQPRRPRSFRERRQRGPPEDGIVSKTKVMVANLPYDYSEEKVSSIYPASLSLATC